MKRVSSPDQNNWSLRLVSLFVLVSASMAAPAASQPKTPFVVKWSRFEQVFHSDVIYSNALQQAALTVAFVSPVGETNTVDGFWDGGKTWRVRFSPDLPGRWTFKTTCSDTANTGLHNQTGAFLCTAAAGKTRFDRHGPVRVARDHRYFEHADLTPFLWIGDVMWNAARISELTDWELYAGVRAEQKFTVVQWALAPGKDYKKETAFTGKESIILNPDFFKRLDPKVDALGRAGLLSALAPLWEIGATGADEALPEDQAVLLLRYVVARWGANPVAWVVAFEGDSIGKKVDRWKRIGRAVFAERRHAPVILLPGETNWLLDEFRNEEWADAFGYTVPQNTDENSLQWLLSGPLAMEWRKAAVRPVINLAPPAEDGVAGKPGTRFGADDVRRLMWWSLLLNAPAGVAYSANGTMKWDMTKVSNIPGAQSTNLPAWQQALSLPAAKQVAPLGDFFNSIDFWRLRPAPRLVANQPGNQSPRRYLAAAATEAKDLTLVYVPEDRTAELLLAALPPSPSIAWLDPRTGATNPAAAVVNGRTCQFSTPGPGDWLLVLKTTK
jgi:hypothetical protein